MTTVLQIAVVKLMVLLQLSAVAMDNQQKPYPQKTCGAWINANTLLMGVCHLKINP
jgi:hypothetical protein